MIIDGDTIRDEDDVAHALGHIQNEMLRGVMQEYLDRDRDDIEARQSWRLISFPRLKKIWEDHASMGVVHDTRGLDTIMEICLENTAKIWINSMVCGHTSNSPCEYINDCDFLSEKLTEEMVEAFWEVWCDDEKGCSRISDYGIEPLYKECTKIMLAPNDMQKLCAVDALLQVTHMQSDLAAWFVEGGSEALSELSGYLRDDTAM